MVTTAGGLAVAGNAIGAGSEEARMQQISRLYNRWTAERRRLERLEDEIFPISARQEAENAQD